MKRLHIRIKGIVQGVGFRPFIYNLAGAMDVKGYATNSSDGVIIEVEGERLDEFLKSIKSKCPPLAKIDSFETLEMPAKGYEDFSIIESLEQGGFTLISPDIAICEDCLREMLDSSDRRYLYPFINCTNCGPRYSITTKVPYDRPNTTMSVFDMCPQCLCEYNDPSNRRFHAQPNACPECGPQVELRDKDLDSGGQKNKNPIEATVNLLKHGAIVAVKGIGGFHLCCDAENEDAVKRLREHKRRSNKPFALMSPDVDTVRRFCNVFVDEEILLKDRRRPIVLLNKNEGAQKLPDAIAPNNKYLGFMLPYAPLHYLLFYDTSFSALVMTSGNISEEPIVIDNDEAISKLLFVDAFLLHNRDIFMRVDDSVVRKKFIVRRARGFAPEPIKLDNDGVEVLACGADIKNAFTITKGRYAVMSQHIGDMENLETLHFFEETLNNLKQVYRADPAAIAFDLHPNYMSTKWAIGEIENSKVQGIGIQHHYAHIASVMAEHGIKERVIGVAFDGTGYGADGNIWGSEFLVCDLNGFERKAHFKYIPLPGGDKAVKECWRTAVSYIADCGLQDADLWNCIDNIGFIEKYGRDKIENIMKILGNKQFSPLSSGAGRLFDAVAAITGICDFNTFEGEAAIALENVASAAFSSDSYSYDVHEGESMIIDFAKTIRGIIEDIALGESTEMIAAKFHNTLIASVLDIVCRISSDTGIVKAALSGGVFQNELLMKNIKPTLVQKGIAVFTNEQVPCNDAGISLGQAYIARERLSCSSQEKRLQV
jgi:hydrogenase maturation protein HypF